MWGCVAGGGFDHDLFALEAWEDFVVECQGVLWDEQVAAGFAREERTSALFGEGAEMVLGASTGADHRATTGDLRRSSGIEAITAIKKLTE